MPNDKKKANKPVEDIEAKKAAILEKAKKAGHIDQKDITSVIPDTQENVEVLDQLYTELADAGVEIGMPEPDIANFDSDWALDNMESEEEVLPETNGYLDDDVA